MPHSFMLHHTNPACSLDVRKNGWVGGWMDGQKVDLFIHPFATSDAL